MSVNTVTTIYDENITLSIKYNIPFSTPPGTTLNDKFGIPYAVPPSVGYPKLNYLAIGNGGQVVVTGESFISGLMHSCTDSALKNQIPFLLLPANADLSLAEMAAYRIRVPMTIGGNAYVAYYLKLLNFAPMTVGFTTFQLSEGVVTNQSPYTPTLATQTPNMIDSSNVALNLASGNQIATTIETAIQLSETEVQNIINACTILYGNPNAAIISELALVAGFDIQSPITVASVSTTYTEVQCAQVTNFISIVFPANANPNSSMNAGVSIGMSQPLNTLT